MVELNRTPIGRPEASDGIAGYFATRWFTGRDVFRELDSWVRRRIRCMKFKRYSIHDNRRMRLKQFQRLGLLSLESFYWS